MAHSRGWSPALPPRGFAQHRSREPREEQTLPEVQAEAGRVLVTQPQKSESFHHAPLARGKSQGAQLKGQQAPQGTDPGGVALGGGASPPAVRVTWQVWCRDGGGGVSAGSGGGSMVLCRRQGSRRSSPGKGGGRSVAAVPGMNDSNASG